MLVFSIHVIIRNITRLHINCILLKSDFKLLSLFFQDHDWRPWAILFYCYCHFIFERERHIFPYSVEKHVFKTMVFFKFYSLAVTIKKTFTKVAIRPASSCALRLIRFNRWCLTEFKCRSADFSRTRLSDRTLSIENTLNVNFRAIPDRNLVDFRRVIGIHMVLYSCKDATFLDAFFRNFTVVNEWMNISLY